MVGPPGRVGADDDGALGWNHRNETRTGVKQKATGGTEEPPRSENPPAPATRASLVRSAQLKHRRAATKCVAWRCTGGCTARLQRGKPRKSPGSRVFVPLRSFPAPVGSARRHPLDLDAFWRSTGRDTGRRAPASAACRLYRGSGPLYNARAPRVVPILGLWIAMHAGTIEFATHSTGQHISYTVSGGRGMIFMSCVGSTVYLALD